MKLWWRLIDDLQYRCWVAIVDCKFWVGLFHSDLGYELYVDHYCRDVPQLFMLGDSLRTVIPPGRQELQTEIL